MRKACMQRPSFNSQGSHRRSFPRLRLGMLARLETLHGTWEVDLLDLSQTGAKLDIASRPTVPTGVLHWLKFEALGDLAWREGELLAITFAQPLGLPIIVATRDLSPAVIGINSVSQAARAWATGSAS